MKKLIITSLVLGLSSAAFAAPGSQGYNDRDRDRDEHGLRQPAPPQIRDHRMPLRWMALSSNLRVSGKKAIAIRSQAVFSQLKLEAAAGSTFIDKVVITFGNGRSQTVNLDKWLTSRTPLSIDLNGNLRKVTKVTVYGKGARRSSIKLLGA